MESRITIENQGDGGGRRVKLIFSRIETGDPNDYKYVFMVQNIHEEATAIFTSLKKLSEMALTDSLTGVFNRGKIESSVNNAVKEWNDEHGHAAGDKTLKRFAHIMTDCFKDENADIGRWGGEEFVVVLYNRSLDEAGDRAERFRTAVADAVMTDSKKVTCSIGVTEVRENDRFEDVFERMDKALYAAKSDGRNRVEKG